MKARCTGRSSSSVKALKWHHLSQKEGPCSFVHLWGKEIGPGCRGSRSWMDAKRNQQRKGVYCAYLFKHDMTGFYLTLTQGISEHIKRLGTTDGLKLLIAKSDSIRSIVRSVRDHGFSSGEGIDLVDEARPNALYKAATVVSKFYVTGAIPETKTLFDDLTALLGVYDRYITSSRLVRSS